MPHTLFMRDRLPCAETPDPYPAPREIRANKPTFEAPTATCLLPRKPVGPLGSSIVGRRRSEKKRISIAVLPESQRLSGGREPQTARCALAIAPLARAEIASTRSKAMQYDRQLFAHDSLRLRGNSWPSCQRRRRLRVGNRDFVQELAE